MTTLIVLFLVFGAGFGLSTYSRQHLFSEGPTRDGKEGEKNPSNGRVTWVLVCTFLWPIMALTGLHSLWLLARRRAASARR